MTGPDDYSKEECEEGISRMMDADPTPEEKQARRALKCLYITVDERVANDVTRDVLHWVDAAVAAENEACAVEIEQLRAMVDAAVSVTIKRCAAEVMSRKHISVVAGESPQRSVDWERGCIYAAIHALQSEATSTTFQKIRVIFDRDPGDETGRFVEVEDLSGEGMQIGKWIELDGEYRGMWALEFTAVTRTFTPNTEQGDTT